MSRCVVDTNVAVVANGRSNPSEPRPPTVACRKRAVALLMEVVSKGTVLLDADGAIQSEYRRHLNPSGSPGVGDRFYQEVLHSSPRLIARVSLPKRPDGEYADLPDTLVNSSFDQSDRKFAALAKREGVPVYNATDSDWIEHGALLSAGGIDVQNLCGCDITLWFAA